MEDVYRAYRVEKKFRENKLVTTLLLDANLDCKPGQFVMAWEPGVGEIPLSIAAGKPFTLSIGAVGETSKALANKKEGEKIFIRGPFGKPFSLQGKRVVCVGGGYGVAPLRFLAKKAREKKIDVLFCMGARTKDLLMLKPDCTTFITTDDGSFGEKGFATDSLEKTLSEQKIDCVYACGPEKMMARVLDICIRQKVKTQLSLERLMKCGLGICGSCAIDGKLVCKDGPVFTGDEVRSLREFGKTSRDASGTPKEV